MHASLREARGEPPRLRRGIRRLDLLLLSINIVIGAGIFGLPAQAGALLGASSVLAFPLTALVAGVIVLCYAEVSSRFDATGGPYLYARHTFGEAAGFLVGWLLWTARMAAFAAVTSLLLDYVAYVAPAVAAGPARGALGAALVLFYTLVNLAGVRASALVSNLFTAAKLAPLLVFVAVGAVHIEPARVTLGALPAPGALSTAVLLLSFTFGGFESLCILAGETREARRNLPLALLTAIGVAALLYTLVQLVCVGTLPGLARSAHPLADAGERFLGPWGARMIAVGAVIAAAGSLQATTLAIPRLPFAMAQDGLLPRLFAATHARLRVPYVAILVTSAVMLYMTLAGTFVSSLTFSLVARLAAWACTCAALPVLRRRKGAPPAAFRAPAGVAVAGLALVFCVWMLSGAKARELANGAVAAGVGVAVYGAVLLARRRASHRVRGSPRD